MKARILLLGASILLAATGALAQHLPPPTAPDAVAENLFPPELILGHQEAIALSPEQKSFIREEVGKAQAQFTNLKWQLQDAMEILVSQLKQTPADEQRVLGQLEKVLAAEREIKRTQMSLMIRIKNKLTPEQQVRLRELRQQMHKNAGPPGGE